MMKHWLLTVPVLAWGCAPAGAEPPVAIPDQIVNPVAPPAVERVELPQQLPGVELASYWRAAKPEKPAATPVTVPASAAPDAENPPEPAAMAELGQPAWLLPEPVELQKIEPVEPEGPAVVVDDQTPPKTAEQVIQLAMAKMEHVPSRSAALLVVARELAVDATSVGDYGDVIDQCHRAIDAGPDQSTGQALARLGAWAYNRRGELLVAGGNEHDAFDDFQEAILLDGTCWQAMHNRGVTLARYAKHTEALSDFNRVVDLAPGFAVARYNRAELLSQMERWPEAVDDYNVAIQAMPNEADLYSARGAAYTQMGKANEAASDFNTALRIDPGSSEAYLGRGNLFASQALYEQAAADFERSLRLNPRSARAYHSTAWLLATCPLDRYRNGQQAIEAASRLARLLGNEDPMVLDTLAVAHATAGDFQQAIAYEEQAIVLATDANDKREYRERLKRFRQGETYRTE
ncbi:tetratricopeptide repeat protein [Aeoliella mucimassa]|nr:tetratricopeptide repeat protein [Aeoliella mucimassa]